jgi:hypothetical protein
MIDKDIVIHGKFEEAKYNVTYAFYENDLPSDYKKYLPSVKSYSPGDIVKLDTITSVSGYKFLGWYMDDEFVMPDENVVVYGEWRKDSVSIEPVINIEIVNDNDYFMIGDSILYKITVTNSSIFDINDVLVNINNEKAYFLDSDDYSILSDHMIGIDLIKSGTNAIVYAQYDVSAKDTGDISNEVEIVGANNENGSVLGDSSYKTNISFKVMPTIEVCNKVSGYDSKNVFQFIVSGDNYESWINLVGDECRTISVVPGMYKVKEIVPQEYTISSVSGVVPVNDYEFEVLDSSSNNITYTNKFRYKKFYHAFGRSFGKILGGE